MPVQRNIRLLAWFNFWLEFRLYAPIAILYFSQITGSYALGMSVFSAARLAQFLFEVPTGVFSDLIGRKKTMVYGALAGMLSLIFYAIGGSHLALLIGAFVEGLAWALFSGNNEAFLHDTLKQMGKPETYQEFLGKTTSTHMIALGISAVIGSLIAAISFQWVMWLSVIPALFALFVSLRFVPPQVVTDVDTNAYTHLKTAFRNIIQNVRLRNLSAASILSFAIGESAWSLRSAFIQLLWPVWALGFAQMLGDASAAIGFYFAGRIIRRFGEFRLLIGGKLFSFAVDLFALLVPTVVSPALTALNSVFYGVNNVATSGLIQREFTDEQRATMGSLNSFVGSLGFVVFSVLLGVLADQIGVIPALVLATLLGIIPIFLYYWALRVPEKEVASRQFSLNR